MEAARWPRARALQLSAATQLWIWTKLIRQGDNAWNDRSADGAHNHKDQHFPSGLDSSKDHHTQHRRDSWSAACLFSRDVNMKGYLPSRQYLSLLRSTQSRPGSTLDVSISENWELALLWTLLRTRTLRVDWLPATTSELEMQTAWETASKRESLIDRTRTTMPGIQTCHGHPSARVTGGSLESSQPALDSQAPPRLLNLPLANWLWNNSSQRLNRNTLYKTELGPRAEKTP